MWKNSEGRKCPYHGHLAKQLKIGFSVKFSDRSRNHSLIPQISSLKKKKKKKR
jgi:hypothetical protein